MLASRCPKAATEEVNNKQQGPSLPPPTPKKDAYLYSGSLRPQTTATPLRNRQLLSNHKTASLKKAVSAKPAVPKKKKIPLLQNQLTR